MRVHVTVLLLLACGLASAQNAAPPADPVGTVRKVEFIEMPPLPQERSAPVETASTGPAVGEAVAPQAAETRVSRVAEGAEDEPAAPPVASGQTAAQSSSSSSSMTYVLAACIVLLVLRKLRRRPARVALPKGINVQNLLRLCGGDRTKAKRLMNYEKRRALFVSDEQAASRAIHRWERDRR